MLGKGNDTAIPHVAYIPAWSRLRSVRRRQLTGRMAFFLSKFLPALVFSLGGGLPLHHCVARSPDPQTFPDSDCSQRGGAGHPILGNQAVSHLLVRPLETRNIPRGSYRYSAKRAIIFAMKTLVSSRPRFRYRRRCSGPAVHSHRGRRLRCGYRGPPAGACRAVARLSRDWRAMRNRSRYT